MHAVRLPTQLVRPLDTGTQQSGPLENTVTDAAGRLRPLSFRDHRDDGSMISGLFIGLGLGILAWGLVIALIWMLL